MEAKIVRLVRESFCGCTVICVAHKLGTIMDFDTVIVLDQGRILERGHPATLALEPSVFASMLQASAASSGPQQEKNEKS